MAASGGFSVRYVVTKSLLGAVAVCTVSLASPSWPMAGLVDVSDVDVNSRFPSFSRGRDAAACEGITL